MNEPQGLRQRLLDEAIAALDHGAGEPSLRALARQLGVSAMASYRHFPSKAALLGAVVAEGFARLETALRAADQSAPGAEALMAQGLAYVDFAMAQPGLFRLMFGLAGRDGGAASRDHAYGVLTARITALLPRPAPGAALACWALVHGLATLQLDRGGALSRQDLRQALAVVMHGLAAG
ncbi:MULTISPECIES: TetR/AcrR family transcriptional regulator [unclassified Novosphingobium]|uniref:WHG domain-containing protein n=1 Tax=unclassified Novosphingobium TaxID=2644732 RepID=UPI00146DA819|nr:AcrR family transcriptional regulator [Novosphingobium sp. SG919]NMN89423.1 AcrR family transcriptional regulator [Novosphingobium sp. SG916]